MIFITHIVGGLFLIGICDNINNIYKFFSLQQRIIPSNLTYNINIMQFLKNNFKNNIKST